MSPAFDRGDVVVVEKLSRWWRPPARGDVLVVDVGSTTIMKRVVAVAGDSLAMHDSVLVVNGRRVEEPYVDHRTIDGMFVGRTVVPEGAVFLMGDDRDRSVDSRHFGTVPVDDVTGRVIAHLP